MPLFSIDWLPEVTPSFGVFSVSPEIICTRSKRQVELFRRDLRQRRDDALAELDLAGEDRRVAVGVDADPGVEHAVVIEAAGQPCGLLRAKRAAEQA